MTIFSITLSNGMELNFSGSASGKVLITLNDGVEIIAENIESVEELRKGLSVAGAI